MATKLGIARRFLSASAAMGARGGQNLRVGAQRKWMDSSLANLAYNHNRRNSSSSVSSDAGAAPKPNKMQPSVAFIPVLKHGSPGEPFVLVLSRKPQDVRNGFITIVPFTADVKLGENLLKASSRELLDGTGLAVSQALDASIKRIYSNPFNSASDEQFLAVEVDMSSPANAGVHPGDRYALQGDDVVVIRSPLSEFSQALDQLASNGRIIDSRLLAFALGTDLALQSSPAKGGVPLTFERLGTALGGAWMIGSIIIGGAFFANSSGYSVSLPGIVS